MNGYIYMGAMFDDVWLTSAPITDEQALDYFATVNEMFPKAGIKHVKVRRTGETEYTILPFVFRKETNEVVDWEDEYGEPAQQKVD